MRTALRRAAALSSHVSGVGRRSERALAGVAAWKPQVFTGGGGTTTAGLVRTGFQLQFKPGELEPYLVDHEAVWPEMQQALADSGWHNYSLFYRDDGYAFGYFETETDFATACAKMDETDVNGKWQAAMSKYTPAGTSPVDAAMELEHYFYIGTDRVLTSATTVKPTQPTGWSPQQYTGGGGTTVSGLNRVCFQLKFEPAELNQYLIDHETMWPEMQQALVDCGWHNYSLFYRPDGFAVGYFETDTDFDAACAKMGATDVNKRWQAAMSKYTPANVSPIDAAMELKHYFYLGTDRKM